MLKDLLPITDICKSVNISVFCELDYYRWSLQTTAVDDVIIDLYQSYRLVSDIDFYRGHHLTEPLGNKLGSCINC